MDTFIVGRRDEKIQSTRDENQCFYQKLVERLCDIKIYAISVLNFIGSVRAPDKATIKAKNHALQCTTAGPYNAVNSKLLEVGSVCGLGPDLVGIHPTSLAARYRVAACSSTLGRGLGKVSAARGHKCTPLFCYPSLGTRVSCSLHGLQHCERI